MLDNLLFTVGGGVLLVALGIIAMIAKWYRKTSQGQALVKTGVGGTKVSFNGILIVPVLEVVAY